MKIKLFLWFIVFSLCLICSTYTTDETRNENVKISYNEYEHSQLHILDEKYEEIKM